MSLQVV